MSIVTVSAATSGAITSWPSRSFATTEHLPAATQLSAELLATPLVTGRAQDHCGSVIVTLTPPPSRFASATRPPCASAISRTSARPRPVPPRFVE